jgi:hypothetical protein
MLHLKDVPTSLFSLSGLDTGSHMSDFSPMLLPTGPVLRRVTETSVSVWVATSQSRTVTLDAYGASAFLTQTPQAQVGTVGAPSIGTGSRGMVSVGRALQTTKAMGQ